MSTSKLLISNTSESNLEVEFKFVTSSFIFNYFFITLCRRIFQTYIFFMLIKSFKDKKQFEFYLKI